MKCLHTRPRMSNNNTNNKRKLAPIHQSHVHGWIKIWLTIFEKGHSRIISMNWGLEATDSCAYRLDLFTELTGLVAELYNL